MNPQTFFGFISLPTNVFTPPLIFVFLIIFICFFYFIYQKARIYSGHLFKRRFKKNKFSIIPLTKSLYILNNSVFIYTLPYTTDLWIYNLNLTLSDSTLSNKKTENNLLAEIDKLGTIKYIVLSSTKKSEVCHVYNTKNNFELRFLNNRFYTAYCSTFPFRNVQERAPKIIVCGEERFYKRLIDNVNSFDIKVPNLSIKDRKQFVEREFWQLKMIRRLKKSWAGIQSFCYPSDKVLNYVRVIVLDLEDDGFGIIVPQKLLKQNFFLQMFHFCTFELFNSRVNFWKFLMKSLKEKRKRIRFIYIGGVNCFIKANFEKNFMKLLMYN